jgi:hypothetical protein
MRRMLSGLLFLLLVGGSLLAMVSPASAAAPLGTSCYGPCPPPATLSVTVIYNSNGTITLKATGSGFAPNETVNFWINKPTRQVGSFPADPQGTVIASILLPGAVPPASHDLVAVGVTSGRVATAHFVTTKSSGVVQPCTAAAVRSSGVVLAAFVVTACFHNQAPPPAVARALGNGQGSSALPFTGADSAALAGIGAAAIGAGGLLVLSARRRRAQRWQTN